MKKKDIKVCQKKKKLKEHQINYRKANKSKKT